MKIGLLGHGVVGSGVQQIIDAGATWEVRELEVKRILVKDESEIDDPARMTTDVNEILNDPEIEVVAECMGGVEPAHTYAKRALENKKHFVTSNKKMLATCVEDLFDPETPSIFAAAVCVIPFSRRNAPKAVSRDFLRRLLL